MLFGVAVSHLRVLFLSALLASSSVGAFSVPAGSDSLGPFSPRQTNVVESFGKLPLSFEANRGQADKSVRFLSRGAGYGLYLTGEELVLALDKSDCRERAGANAGNAVSWSQPLAARRDIPSCTRQTDLVRMRLVGTRRDEVTPAGEQHLSGIANYIVGNDPAKWHTGVPTYGKVRYSNIYSGVDLVYYGNQRQLEYDFIVAPGADAKPIRLHFGGTRELHLDADGDLVVTASGGGLTFHKPLVYQVVDGHRKTIEGGFALLARHTVGFRLGAYDRRIPLVIDPVLVYSTYLGGAGSNGFGDAAKALAVDASGDAYVAGFTYSTNFPVTPGALKSSNLSSTAFIAELNPDGTGLVYSTFLGGSSGDAVTALAIDAAGDAYVTGKTWSSDFPVTAGALQSTFLGSAYSGISNAFVTVLNPAGSGLVYSTYLGGSGGSARSVGPGYGDGATSLVLDGSGDAFIGGWTTSTDFPVTKGAFQTTNPAGGLSNSGFVAKLNRAGSALVYSTYLGGSSAYGDVVNGLAVDGTGNAYVTGYATSLDFPVTQGAFQTANHSTLSPGYSAFVTKLNAAGTAQIYSTSLGGSGDDIGNALAVDGGGNAYITGQADSPDFPVTQGAFQTRTHGITAFVCKLNAAGSSQIYSTFLGGSVADQAFALAVDGAGDAFVTGYTLSGDFPTTTGSFQQTKGGAALAGNAFIAEVAPSGAALLYSTYLGGSGGISSSDCPADDGLGIALDSSGAVYAVGIACSSDFPVTQGAFQTTNQAWSSWGSNAFVAKLNPVPKDATTLTLTSSANPQQFGETVVFTADLETASGTGQPTGTVTFSLDNGNTGAAYAVFGSGTVQWSTSKLKLGQHAIAATYGGDQIYAPSSASLTEIVVKAQGTPTTTTLAVSSAGFPVSLVSLGSVVTLTAQVSAGATPVTAGQVNFCDAAYASCTDIHLLGTAQLTQSGTAQVKLRPGMGSHKYQAFFLGTYSNPASYSSAVLLAVGPAAGTPFQTATTITQTGVVGNYTLTAKVTGAGGTSSPSGTVSFLDTTNANSVVGTAALTPGTSGLTWPAPQPLPLGFAPQSIAVGDFNGDGIPDLAMVNLTDNTVVIFQGNGDGTFTTLPATLAIDPAPGSYNKGILVSDFNGDGNEDLAVLTSYSGAAPGTVTIFLGNGDGTFTPVPSTAATGGNPSSMAVGDFNGDGIPDLAVADFYDNAVRILLGNGDGTFLEGSYPATGAGPLSVAVADFNGDGVPDLVLAGGNSIAILLGNGDGTFSRTAVSPQSLGGSGAVAVGDFNGDGKVDLAVVNYYSPSVVTILLDNGDGTFTSKGQPLSAGNGASAIAVGDFNGDGIADLTIASSNGDTEVFYLGNGDGTFTYETSFPTGGRALCVASADFNGDGLQDVAIPHLYDSSMTVLLASMLRSATATATRISVLGSGIHQIDASYPGDSIFGASVSGTVSLNAKELPVITWATPAPISYGTALSATQLNAQASVAGTFTYNPAAGTVLSGGTHTLSASFVPIASSDYTTASATVPLVVNQAKSSSVLKSSASSISYGASVNLTATVSGIGAAPSGTVTFLDGTAQLGTGTLSNAGVATCTATGLGGGSHSITANYSGDTNYTPATSSAVTVTVTKAAQKIAFSPVPASVAYGASPIALSATASSGLAVTFSATGPATLSGNTLTITGAGSLVVTANQAGNANYAAASAVSQTIKVSKAAATAVVASSEAAGIYGASVTLTATLTGSVNTPTGSVTFQCGSTALGTSSLSSGVATLTITTLPVGTDSLKASYAGDANYSAATSAAINVTVSKAPQTIDFVRLAATLAYGAGPMKLVAAASSGLPVTFSATGPATLTGATLTIAGAGTVVVTAAQPGNGNYAAAAPVSQTIAITKGIPAIALAASAAAVVLGKSVTLTATLTGGGVKPSGSVSFLNGTAVLGNGTLNASGVATLAVSTLPAGTYSISASYAGDSRYASATSTALTETVTLPAPTIKLASSSSSVSYGSPVTLTATLTGSGARPGGTVSFLSGTASLGTGTVNSSGVATFALNSLPVGKASIAASYSGDSNYAPAASSVIVVTVNKATPAASLTASANTIAAGAQVTFTATVAGPGLVAPSGSVTFVDGTTALGAGSLSSGAATYSTSKLTKGSHTITAKYGGDGNYLVVTSGAVKVTVTAGN